jgi:pantothenate kinase-related protein Tda10
MVRLIGISGATGSGKDTMARIIQNSCLDSLPPEYRLSLEEVTTVSKINNPERLQILE